MIRRFNSCHHQQSVCFYHESLLWIDGRHMSLMSIRIPGPWYQGTW